MFEEIEADADRELSAVFEQTQDETLAMVKMIGDTLKMLDNNGRIVALHLDLAETGAQALMGDKDDPSIMAERLRVRLNIARVLLIQAAECAGWSGLDNYFMDRRSHMILHSMSIDDDDTCRENLEAADKFQETLGFYNNEQFNFAGAMYQVLNEVSLANMVQAAYVIDNEEDEGDNDDSN